MKIALITGGETGEREVSIRSARNIQDSIDFADLDMFTFPEDKEKFLLFYKYFDLVIPVIHGIGGEDGSLQGLLNELDIPFLFSEVNTHAIGIDKQFTKDIASRIGLLIPPNTNSFPLFAKPRCGGSSIASKLCISEEELQLLKSEAPGFEFITEEPIKGREFTVGIIEYKGKLIPLPVIEIIPKGNFFDFENKYNPEKLATEVCPAEIDEDLCKELQKQALMIHTHLKARHISRSDFIVTSENNIYFLEINTIPGMTDTSLIPKMLTAQNLSLTDLLREWCLD